ncbi:AbrB/MazE/SpoVT family DNA-binding domain-containing protein [Candidatus Woesearchaeota archaeon]|nr:AbrB/MazE/SpoVT family DNA-binding domain-containing protein [Candidatus Woesearchaeota archaeon]
MEFRKLIGFGKNSYIISLPKAWVQKNKLKKGDPIYIEERDGDISLYPGIKEESDAKEITIDVDGKSIKEIKRELVPAYINNFTTIMLTGKELKKRAKQIRDLIHDLVALEIIEQTSEKIITKSFLNAKELSVKDLIRKMEIMTRAMISDSKSVISESSYENIRHRDDDVNRLYYLLLRILKYALNNPSLASNYFKMSSAAILDAWRIAYVLEEIADEAKRTARYLALVRLSNADKKSLIDLLSLVEDTYLNTMKAYYTDDRELIYRMARRKAEIIKQCDELYEHMWNKKYVPTVIEKFKFMAAATHNIGRIVYT